MGGNGESINFLKCRATIDFASNGAWDVHLKKVLDNGRKKVSQLHSVISNRDINLRARRLLLLSVIRPSIEYGGEYGKVIRVR